VPALGRTTVVDRLALTHRRPRSACGRGRAARSSRRR
jgi:hypothetical protein